MRFLTLTLGAALASVISAYPGWHDPPCYGQHCYQRPGRRDVRSPCPMLNSLANHGFVARSGKNISIEEMISALDEALNVDPASTRPVVELAATTSSTGHEGTFNLDDLALNGHGVIEHDGSLSRNDIFFGDNNRFNPRIYRTVSRYFRKPLISIETAAKARTDRIERARRINPDFTFGAAEDQFSQFETALYLVVYGNWTYGDARREWVDVMFREERIPYAEGFRRTTRQITNDAIVELAQKVADASQVDFLK